MNQRLWLIANNFLLLVWVSKWVDYSDKYGFGCQLSDDTITMIFNDSPNFYCCWWKASQVNCAQVIKLKLFNVCTVNHYSYQGLFIMWFGAALQNGELSIRHRKETGITNLLPVLYARQLDQNRYSSAWSRWTHSTFFSSPIVPYGKGRRHAFNKRQSTGNLTKTWFI